MTSVGALGVGFAVVPAHAAAQEPATVRSGWWSAAPLAVAVAPDAPENGLLIQGGPNAENPAAYAAISANLAPGTTATALTLAIAPDSATTPTATLAACPLTEAFQPAQGGPRDDAPDFDCASRSTAEAPEDGSAYRFDLSGLPLSEEIAVAIVPTTATDRVVLAPPGPGAVESSGGTAEDEAAVSDFGPSSGDTGASLGAFDSAPAGSATFDGPPAPTGELPDAALGAEEAVGGAEGEAPTAVDDGAGDATANAPDDLAAQPVSSSDDGRPLAPFVFGGLAAAAAALWGVAGQGTEDEGEPA